MFITNPENMIASLFLTSTVPSTTGLSVELGDSCQSLEDAKSLHEYREKEAEDGRWRPYSYW